MFGQSRLLLVVGAVIFAGTGLVAFAQSQPAQNAQAAEPDPMLDAMKFVKVPKGSFWMGWNNDQKLCREEYIDNDFDLAAYTVTQEQWQALMGNNPSFFSRQGGGKEKVKKIPDEDLKRFPVESVSWEDAQAYIKKLNEREKGKGWVYRLPTEAEWEYACRGAVHTKQECSFDYYFDIATNAIGPTKANFNSMAVVTTGTRGPSLERTTKVGSYPPNKLGLYDMHGNVWQWCEDIMDKGPERVIRGGGWSASARLVRAGDRQPNPQNEGGDFLGFRLVRMPESKK